MNDRTTSTRDPIARLTLPGARDLLPLAAAIPSRYPCLLESAGGSGKNARYDILFACPEESIELHRDGIVRNFAGVNSGTDFLDVLDSAWRRLRRIASADDLPFTGGWLVFLTYELAAQIEPRLVLRPAPETAIPIALALRCPAAIIVDRMLRTTTIVADDTTLIGQLQRDLEMNCGDTRDRVVVQSVEEDDPQRFLDGVARIHDYLHSGDTFQVNLSREWRARCARDTKPAALYAQLRDANPSPFAGLLQWKNWAVVSSSPERLVEVRDGIAQTRPIAGTRPRASHDDAARIRELIAHPKERAEHVMLIDLERNDLGRICKPGSVCVDELMTVESYAHVHHIVSNVRGELRDDVGPGDVIRAVFPGGTITGCPKVRCMEIIAELEREGRGAYTGALGFLDDGGNMDLNILIRTLTLCEGRIRFRAGAGIVADSDAQRELEETRAKARGLLRALGAVP
ncbi:MAG: aminodeoxychorismate synthase component I [Rudaea sp.]